MSESAHSLLGQNISNLLDTLITSDELMATIQSTPTGKSPGLDGFIPKFGKTYKELLRQFLNVFNSVSNETPFLGQALDARIFLMSKLEKDNFYCSTYPSYSIVGVDLKLCAKMIAYFTAITPATDYPP